MNNDERRQIAPLAVLRDLEQRVIASQYQELNLWKDDRLFTINKGTWASTERWHLYANGNDYYGDTAEEVVNQAEQEYPLIRQWLPEFNTR
jgi:hypothetical protein